MLLQNEKHIMNYSDNCSLFISLMTMPFGKEEDFYKKDIKAIIDGYKKKQNNFAKIHSGKRKEQESAKKDFDKYLYNPRAYYLFGNYDLAIISLIDDYTLTNRNFHPYSYFISQQDRDRKYSEKFNYQILTGPAPVLLSQLRKPLKKEELYDSNLINLAKRTFLIEDERKKFPFIGITRLKLNNGLLIGAGAKFVSLVELAIKNIFDEEYKRESLSFILSESFGWNELTITFFSNSFDTISQAIIRIRELRLSDLKKIAEGLFQDQAKYSQFDYYRYIRERSLLTEIIKREGDPDIDIGDAHIFVKTITTFGFDFNFFDSIKLNQNKDELIYPESFHYPDLSLKELELFVKWDVKPGHLIDMINAFSKISKQIRNIELTSGTTDFLYPGSRAENSLESVFLIIKKLVERSFSQKGVNLGKHIRKIDTVLKFKFKKKKFEEIINPKKKSSNFILSDKLIDFSFSLKELDKVRDDLYRSNVSKILREKVLNMFVNYNDGIQDPLLYIYFIELRNFLKEIIKTIAKLANSGEKSVLANDGDEVHLILDKAVDHFELAFKNRFHQSYRMDGVTDFNMEYNGGCQQIISALDGAFKVVSSIFGENNDPTSFIIVTGLSGVDSSIYTMRINYFHIFQPSIFITPVVKESVNHFFSKWVIADEHDNDFDRFRAKMLYRTDFLRDLIYSRLEKEKDEDFLIREYQEFLDKSMLDYFRSDVISYIYAFNFDTKLFRFWYWNYFLQMSSMYNKDGKVDEGKYLRFMMRYLLLIEFFDQKPENHGNGIDNLADIPSFQLNELWSLHFDRLRKFVQLILNDKDNQFKNWLLGACSVAFTLVSNDVIGCDLKDPNDSDEKRKRENEFNQRISAKNAKRTVDSKQSGFESGFEMMIYLLSSRIDRSNQDIVNISRKEKDICPEIIEYYNSLEAKKFDFGDEESSLEYSAQNARITTTVINRYLSIFIMKPYVKQRFKLGEIYSFRNKSKETTSPSLFFQTISCSYLEVLSEDIMTEKKDPLLYRRKYDVPNAKEDSKGKVHTMKKHKKSVKSDFNGALVFDPMGGLFSSHFYTRRKYYKYRSTLIRSLWDMSLKLKKDFFN